ncbi:hypothetical protein BpHYR1_041715 [Brachionus plicatilis]|uniref:Uncharacterized protein n=1 Tax=Brachionus plicatilis TaxID=10195 RepID=A0A3M7PWM3_BRAPC|nr:hypothetical protein BpHYR1_041715 [Brachionus plicatilis]
MGKTSQIRNIYLFIYLFN